MRKLIPVCIILFLIIILLPDIMYSQIPPILPDEPDHAPIDGGLGLLAAAGGAYALKKIRDKSRD